MAVLLGRTSAGTTADFDSAGHTDAWPFVCAVSGLASIIKASTKVANATVTGVRLGIYADASGLPGAKLGDAAVSDLAAARGVGVFSATLANAVSVTAGTTYWLAWTAATANFNFQGDTGGAYQESVSTTPMPDPFGTSNAGPTNAILWAEDAIEDRDAPGTFGPGLPTSPPGIRFPDQNTRVYVNEPRLTRPLYQLHLGQNWDALMVPANQYMFESALDQMTGFQGTPQWDNYKAWNAPFLPVLGYVNMFGDPGDAWEARQADSDAAPLYLAYGTPDALGAYYRFSEDLRSASYKAGFINRCMKIIGDQGEGIFFDDVNPDAGYMFRRAFGAASLTNFDSGAYYTSAVTGYTGWLALLADFLTDVCKEIRATKPTARIMFNTQWAWDLSGRWTDPRATQLLKICDYVSIEGGFSDPGITDTGPGSNGGPDYALRSLWRFWDYLHGLGKSVVTFSRSFSASNRRYEMANYHLMRDPSARDMVGLWNEYPTWPVLDPVYTIDLGHRIGPTVDDGTRASALYENGIVASTPVSKMAAVVFDTPSRNACISVDSPSVWYKLDDAGPMAVAPAVAVDNVGGLNMTPTGSPVWDVAGVTFPSGSSLAAADSAALRMNAGPWTLEFELTAPNPLPASGTFQALMSKGWATIGGWLIYWHGANHTLNYSGSADIGTSVSLVAGETALVAFTYDGTNLRVYKNGALVTGPTAYTANTETADPFRLNLANTGDAAAGWRMGGVEIYPAALTAERLTIHYRGVIADEFTAALSGAGALSATVTTSSAPAVSATLAGSGSMSGAATVMTLVSSSLAGVGALVGASTVPQQVVASLAGSGSLVASVTAPTRATASLAGTGSLVGLATAPVLMTGSLVGLGSLSAAPRAPPLAVASLAGVGSLSAAVAAPLLLSSAMAGVGSLVAGVTAPLTATASLAGSGSLAAGVTAPSLASASLAGQGSIVATPTAAVSVVASLSGVGSLSASVSSSGVASVVASLAGVGSLAAAVTAPTAASASLAGTGAVTAALTAPLLATASLAGVGALAAGVTAPLRATASLAGVGSLSASVTAPTQVASTLAGVGSLSASVTVSSFPFVTATMAGVGSLSAGVTAPSRTTATLAGTGSLSAAVTAPSSVVATVVGQGALSANARAPLGVVASLAGTGSLSAAVQATTKVSASMVGVGGLAAALFTPGSVPIITQPTDLSLDSTRVGSLALDANPVGLTLDSNSVDLVLDATRVGSLALDATRVGALVLDPTRAGALVLDDHSTNLVLDDHSTNLILNLDSA